MKAKVNHNLVTKNYNKGYFSLNGVKWNLERGGREVDWTLVVIAFIIIFFGTLALMRFNNKKK